MLPLLIISLYTHGYFFIPSLHVEFYLYQKIFKTVIQICHNILNSFQKTWQPKDMIWLTSDLLKLFSNNKGSFGTWVYHLLLLVLHSRTDLTLTGTWVQDFTNCSQLGHVPTLDCSRTHNKALQVLQRITIGCSTS